LAGFPYISFDPLFTSELYFNVHHVFCCPKSVYKDYLHATIFSIAAPFLLLELALE